MAHDAYRANLLRLKVTNYLANGEVAKAIDAAQEAVKYPLKSLPAEPLASNVGIDAQAMFDWAPGLEMHGIAQQHSGASVPARNDFDLAEQIMSVILVQFPLRENYAAYARIRHNRANLRLRARHFR